MAPKLVIVYEAGIADDPCEFDNCRFMTSGVQDWQEASFDNTSPSDTLDVTPQRGFREDEWGIDYAKNTSRFWIWDKVPY